MYQTVFNPGVTPVVVSTRGHTCGGGDWATVDTTDDVASAALDAGDVVKVNHDDAAAGDLEPAAVEVMERTQTYSDRADLVAGYSKPQLQKLAVTAGLIGPDDEVLRDDLDVLVIEAVDVDLAPAPAAKAKSTAAADKPAEK